MERHRFKVTEADAGERFDRCFAMRFPDFSRSRIKALIKEGHAQCNGQTLDEPNYRVKPGDSLEITIPAVEDAVPRPEHIPLQVAFEDEYLLVVDKPAGMVVHPAAGNWQGTLVNALIAHCGESLSGIGGVRRPGIVHRLDKLTSGLIVVAKTDMAHKALSRAFADHGRTGKLERRYHTLVWGVLDRTRGTIRANIGRKSDHRQKMAVVAEGGKVAVTHYQVLKTLGGKTEDGAHWDGPIASLVECSLETGRTHQIRVHMAHIGHPLIGDPVYGSGFKSKVEILPEEVRNAVLRLNRQALHASILGFLHPSSAEPMLFESKLPPEMEDIIDQFHISQNLT